MTANRDAQNRKLAEWLGWTEFGICECSERKLVGKDPKGERMGQRHHVPDFFTSEDALAMLLEKARFSVVPSHSTAGDIWIVGSQWMNGTVTMWASGTIQDPDRKTAIVLAALALIDQEKRR